MAFFLIARGPADELTLLSPSLAASRQDALAELSRLTAEPGFAHWDAEVFAVDLETGVPVLLVRPASSQAPSGLEPEPLAAEETVAVVEAPYEPIVEPIAPEEALAEPGAQEAAAPAMEPVGDEAIAEVVAEVAEEDSLKAALQRTAEQMEASGITAPESVGPGDTLEPSDAAPEVAEPATFADAGADAPTQTGEAAAWPWAPLEAEQPAPLEEATAGEAELTAFEGVVGEAQAEEPVAEDAAPEDAEAGPDEVASFVLDALEEPSLDEKPIILTAADDEMLAASRTVILGAYDEAEPASPEAVAEPFEMPVEESAPETVEPEAAPAVQESAPIVPESPDEISDFILDLEAVTTVPEVQATSAAPEPDPVPAPDATYTCNDCVYVDTCPNKDQRLPQDCVSFQWK